MAVYLRSLERVRELAPTAIAPAHGDVITEPEAKIDEYVRHRLEREAKVAAALAGAGGPVTVDQLVPVVYADVDEARYPIARRSLWAHLRKLAGDGRATSSDVDDDAATWQPRTTT
jgi:glyoxylase-like metal-dependent hydrolase (beta-lactamase superfamily II)